MDARDLKEDLDCFDFTRSLAKRGTVNRTEGRDASEKRRRIKEDERPPVMARWLLGEGIPTW